MTPSPWVLSVLPSGALTVEVRAPLRADSLEAWLRKAARS